jgi:hypothetical protein
MSTFGSIISAVFGTKTGAAPVSGAAPASGAPHAGAGSAAAPAPGSPGAAPTVDVAAILDKMVAAKHEKLLWRVSIVDLMATLDLDSSFAARKELAKELGYTGDSHDSASMNIWLHKQMMQALQSHGGKLPPDVKW